MAKLIFRKQTLGGIEGDASLQGNLLKVNAFKVADLLGAKADVKGTVTDFATAPRYDLTFNATLPDADKVLAYAGLPKLLNGKIGAVSANGGVFGTMNALALRNVSATMLGSTARVTGALALGSNFRFDFPTFNLQTQDAGRLVAAASGQPPAAIGAVSAAGAFKGDGQRVAFDGSLTAFGAAMTGHVDATLGERPNINVNLRVPGTLDLDDWLGVSSAPPAAGGAASAPAAAAQAPRATTGKPIDLAALRAFDATVKLETSAVELASIKVAYADLEATLRGGICTISKLTGQFYGGAVDFSGTVDAAKSALAVDLKGSLQGIYFGEMLRGTAGTNSFGNDNLTVAVDGKINVMDISVRGSGRTTEEIRDSLTGRGQVRARSIPWWPRARSAWRRSPPGSAASSAPRWVSARPCCRPSSTTRATSRARSRSPTARCRSTSTRCRARTPWPRSPAAPAWRPPPPTRPSRSTPAGAGRRTMS